MSRANSAAPGTRGGDASAGLEKEEAEGVGAAAVAGRDREYEEDAGPNAAERACGGSRGGTAYATGMAPAPQVAVTE